MDLDLMFVVGSVLTALSIPSILSAFADSRPPRAASVALVLGGGLLVYALSQKPGGVALAEIPDIFFRVIGQFLR